MDIKLLQIPPETTHYLVLDQGIQAYGVQCLHVEFFKLTAEGVWMKFHTTKYNSYPQWIKADRLYYKDAFKDSVIPRLHQL